MYSKEVSKVFNDSYRSDAIKAIEFAKKHQLTNRLDLTNYIDQSILVASLMISQWRNLAADLSTKIGRSSIKFKSMISARDLYKQWAASLEVELENFQNEKYDDLQRPRLIRAAINELTAHSAKTKKIGVSFDPTVDFLKQWEADWRGQIGNGETTGIKPRVLYRRKPRVW